MGRQFENVSSRYGAPMGRCSVHDLDTTRGTVRLFRVNLDSGGYDDGGAYWGLRRRGESLYCAIDRNGDMRFIDATSRPHACLLLNIPWSSLIVPGACEAWARRALIAGRLDCDDVRAWIHESQIVQSEPAASPAVVEIAASPAVVEIAAPTCSGDKEPS